VERGKKSVKKKELRATALSIKEAKKGISNKNEAKSTAESQSELNERISEIKLKVENLGSVINLYQTELTNLENNLKDKVKIREGITSDKIRCGVCHKNFNFAKDQIIKCPFCEAVYHYLCVAFWLTKYNSCPACQNQFLDPNAGIYSTEEDRDKEQ